MSSIEDKKDEKGIKKILLNELKFLEFKIQLNPKEYAYIKSWDEVNDEALVK